MAPLSITGYAGSTRKMVHRPRRFSHAREIYYILCFLAALCIFLVGLFGRNGYFDLKKGRRMLLQKSLEVREREEAVRLQLERIEGLRNDPAEIEKISRDKGYVRPNELIQEVAPATTPPPP